MVLKTKINSQWQQAHRMPKNPSLDHRIAWHLQHQKNCNCRSIPEKLLIEIHKRKSNPQINGIQLRHLYSPFRLINVNIGI